MSIKSLTALLTLACAGTAAAQQPAITEGLHQPESIAIGAGGRIYISETGEYEKANDGYISVLEGGTTRPFASGLDDPHGIKWYRDHLFVADNMGMVWRIDTKGNAERFVDATDFPRKITNFNDLEIDGAGNLYISDSGDWEGRGGAIYRITQQKKISAVITDEDDWKLVSPNGLLMDGPNRLLVVDYTTGNLFRSICGPALRRWRRWPADSARPTDSCATCAAGCSSPTTPGTGSSCWPSRTPSRRRSLRRPWSKGSIRPPTSLSAPTARAC